MVNKSFSRARCSAHSFNTALSEQILSSDWINMIGKVCWDKREAERLKKARASYKEHDPLAQVTLQVNLPVRQ